MPKHAPDVEKRGSESFHKPGKIRIPHYDRMISIKDPSPMSPKFTNENPLANCDKNPTLSKEIPKHHSPAKRRENSQSRSSRKRSTSQENDENNGPMKKVSKTSSHYSSGDDNDEKYEKKQTPD